ncbi:hypothetical protein GBAR_LOCUS22748, partial [Geodia barretti]
CNLHCSYTYIIVCVCVCVTSGVVGVGKETALQFLRASKSGSQSTSDVLDQFQEWRNGSITEDDIESKIQLTVFRYSYYYVSNVA